MLKRAVMVGMFVVLSLIAFAGLASAGLRLGGSGSGSQSVVFDGGSAVGFRGTWDGNRKDDLVRSMIQRPGAEPRLIRWQPSHETGPVNRFDWTRWFGWIGNVEL